MGPHTSPRGGFALASKYHVQIPTFMNYHIENGAFKADIVWRNAPVSAEDFNRHRDENINAHLGTSGDKCIFPYFFQHVPRLPRGTYLSVTEDQLGEWERMVARQLENETNALLLEALDTAKQVIESRKAYMDKAPLPVPCSAEFDPVI